MLRPPNDLNSTQILVVLSNITFEKKKTEDVISDILDRGSNISLSLLLLE